MGERKKGDGYNTRHRKITVFSFKCLKNFLDELSSEENLYIYKYLYSWEGLGSVYLDGHCGDDGIRNKIIQSSAPHLPL